MFQAAPDLSQIIDDSSSGSLSHVGVSVVVYKSLFYWLHSPTTPSLFSNTLVHHPPCHLLHSSNHSLFSGLECFRLRHSPSSGSSQVFLCPQIVTWLIHSPAQTLGSALTFSETSPQLTTILKMASFSISYFPSSGILLEMS